MIQKSLYRVIPNDFQIVLDYLLTAGIQDKHTNSVCGSSLLKVEVSMLGRVTYFVASSLCIDLGIEDADESLRQKHKASQPEKLPRVDDKASAARKAAKLVEADLIRASMEITASLMEEDL